MELFANFSHKVLSDGCLTKPLLPPFSFSGMKLPLSGFETLKVPSAAVGAKTGSSQQIYSILGSTHGAAELCLLTSDQESSSKVVFGPTFSGLLNVCESYGDSNANQAPQVVPATPAPSIPPGLKQRFQPFGSKTPTLTCVAESEVDSAALGPSSTTMRPLAGKRLKKEACQEEEEEGGKKKKKKEKRIKTEPAEEALETVRVKVEPVADVRDDIMAELELQEGGSLEEKRKKKKKKKDREREEEEQGLEPSVTVKQEVIVKSEPKDNLYGDVVEGCGKKKKKKKKSKTDDD